MAVTDQQKLDFLLKKIGYTKTKTGNVDGTGNPGEGSVKQPFAEAIPSPLVVPNSSLWNEADSIPATPPGSDTTQVKVYSASSAVRLTEDITVSTASQARSWIAYSTYNNTSSARLTNWIDTQFGAGYLIKVYNGDPNSGGTPLSAGATNQNWFFDYSAGVLNFNDDTCPVSPSDSIYIVGYRYIGQTGAPTSGISTFSYLDLTVERNLDVGVQGGISTFRNNIDLNADIDVDGHTNLDNVSISGVTTTVNDVYFDGATAGRDIQFLRSANTLKFTDNAMLALGNATDLQLIHNGTDSRIDNNTGNLQIRSNGGISIEGATSGGNADFIKGYSTGDRRVELFNSDIVRLTTTTAGVNVSGTTTTTGLAVTGVSTFTGAIDANGDLDVDGHTNLDNISVAGVSTFTGDATFAGNVSIGGTLTYEDVTNVDSVGLLTARSGIRVTGGVIEAQAGENKIPSLYSNLGALPSAGTYHGMFAHVHSTGRGYFAHAGNWLELVNKETNGTVGTGTETYNIGSLTATAIDLNGDLDVDGHTELDNVAIAGVTTHYDQVFIRQTGSANSTNVMPLRVQAVRGSTTTGIATVLHESTFAIRPEFIFRQNHNGNWNDSNGQTQHWRMLWKAPSETDTTDEVVELKPRTDIGGALTYFSIKVTDNSTGLKNSGLFSSQQVLLYANNTLGFRLSQAGIGITDTIFHEGDTDTKIRFPANDTIRFETAGSQRLNIASNGNISITNDLDVDGNTDLNGDLDVDGHTELDNVNIVGVTTVAGDILPATTATYNLGTNNAGGIGNGRFNNAYFKTSVWILDSTGGFMLGDSMDTRFYHSGTGTLIDHSGTGSFGIRSNNGINFSCSTSAGETAMQIIKDGGIKLYHNFSGTTSSTLRFETTGQGINVIGHSELDNVNISGVTTTAGNVDINADLDVDGHTNLDNVNIVGVTTHQGHVLPSADVTYDLGSSSKQWRNLYADNIVSAPGSGFIGPDLTVRNLKATGISTFEGNARFNSTIAVHDGTTGSNGQYLKSVGTGVTWASFPTLRTRQTFTASAGQTSFTFSYTVNFIDVFVNGIKLTDSEFTATNGTSVVLAVGCFVGDIVELVSYNTVSTGAGGGGGSLNNIVEDTTPQLGGNLDLFGKTITGTGGISMTGVVTATTFIGDGSGLTGITASGTGVVIKNSGSTVGTAGTINFGDNLSVTPISSGIVTVAAGINTSQFNVNKLHVSGITTFTGITTYTESVHFRGGNYKEVWFWAHPNLPQNHMVWKSWVAGGTGGLFIPKSTIYLGDNSRSQIDPHGSGAAGHLRIEQYMDDGDNPLRIFSDFTNINGSPTSSHSSRDIADFNYDDGCALYHFGNKKLQTSGIGITVTGTVVATGADINGDIDVDGHTELDNVNIAGVVTATTFKGALEATSASFSSNIDANGDLDVDGHTNLDNVSIAGITTINGGTLTVSGNFPRFYFIDTEGSDLDAYIVNNDNLLAFGKTNSPTPSNDVLTLNLSSYLATFKGNVAITKDLDVDGHTNLDNLSVAGVSTFGGQINGTVLNLSSNITASGSISAVGANLDNQIIINGTQPKILFVDSNGNPDYELRADGGVFQIIDSTAPATRFKIVGNDAVVGTGITLNGGDGHATYTGIVTALKFVGDGSGLTNLPGGGSYGNNDVDNHLNVSGASSGQILSWNGSDYAWVADQTSGGGSGISTISGVVNIANDLDVDGHTNLDNVSIAGVSTFAGITTVTGNTLFAKQVNVSGVSTFQNASSYQFTVGAGNLIVNGNSIYGSSKIMFLGGNGGDMAYYAGGTSYSDHIFRTLQGGSQIERFRIGASGDIGLSGENYGTSGQVLTSGGSGSAASWTTISSGTDVGITTNLSGTFTASAGSPSTINTFAYHDNDKVVEYTVYIKNGSNFQSQKVLAMRDGTTIHSTQFAVMFSSSLIVQCDATISSGNILLRATPESGVSGSTTYKVKREVM